jgi:4-hydroxy-tetrahydrodipicolinate reductase
MTDKLRILLVGYGKMGKMIKENIDFVNAEISEIVDSEIPAYKKSLNDLDYTAFDVAIEFTHPNVAYNNIIALLSHKIPVVSGTTGWFDKIDGLKKQFNPYDHTLIYSANFSVGMNLFYEIINYASSIINPFNLYDVYGIEKHHKEKVDTPSGTAKIIQEIIYKNTNEVINFSSVRAGTITGEHEVSFDSTFDEITLIHNAKNRIGFVKGALLAAKKAVNIKGFHNFKDIFKEVIS